MNNHLQIDTFRGEYEFLSNFYREAFQYGNLIYPTSEHAFQAAKMVRDADRLRIAHAPTPRIAKNLGRSLPMWMNWDAVKQQVMLDVLRHKFNVPHMADKLTNTRNLYLIEGNTWGDIYWGVCKGIGENHLGRLLMQVRDEINKGVLR